LNSIYYGEFGGLSSSNVKLRNTGSLLEVLLNSPDFISIVSQSEIESGREIISTNGASGLRGFRKIFS
jgi:hypothetical protein